jgi:hypothetical protein
VPELTDSAVTELVVRWRLAQKNHDFAAYSGLYAEHFTGLVARGAGHIDRRGWLSARETSLVLTPALADAPAHIAIGAGGAQVTFTPHPALASGTSLPELFVVSTSQGPKIAREAPVRSAHSELSASPGLWLADERFAFLSTAPDPKWAEGAPSYAGDNAATSGVALPRLPKALRAWLGRTVRVLGESGVVCETRLQRFAIWAQISPDLATAEVWEGCADHAPAPETIARDIWRLSSVEGRSLIAEFSAPCKGALFAADPDLQAPAIAAPQPAAAELGTAALAAFRELPAYARIQEHFKAGSPGAEGAWEDRQGHRSVWSLDLPGRPPLVFVSVTAGSGCASFSASLSALWEVRDGGPNTLLTLLAVPNAEDDGRLTPRALIDLGASGGASLLLGPDGPYAARSLLARTASGYRQTLLTSVPFFGHPC